jgi:hypothetical protein
MHRCGLTGSVCLILMTACAAHFLSWQRRLAGWIFEGLIVASCLLSAFMLVQRTVDSSGWSLQRPAWFKVRHGLSLAVSTTSTKLSCAFTGIRCLVVKAAYHHLPWMVSTGEVCS